MATGSIAVWLAMPLPRAGSLLAGSGARQGEHDSGEGTEGLGSLAHRVGFAFVCPGGKPFLSQCILISTQTSKRARLDEIRFAHLRTVQGRLRARRSDEQGARVEGTRNGWFESGSGGRHRTFLALEIWVLGLVDNHDITLLRIRYCGLSDG